MKIIVRMFKSTIGPLGLLVGTSTTTVLISVAGLSKMFTVAELMLLLSLNIFGWYLFWSEVFGKRKNDINNS